MKPTARTGEPDYSALRSTVQRLHGWEPLHVEGSLPADLTATCIRTGPGIFDRFGHRVDHAFEADGVMVGLRVGGGEAQAAVRAVESPEYLAEERAGRHLYGPGAPRWRRWLNGLRRESKATGNTALLHWQGRVFALMEAAGPVEVDPSTLATRGKSDLDGVVRGPFSAHPHRLASSGTVYNFGQHYDRKPELRLYALPERGRPRRLGAVQLPWNSMVHDFAVTPRFGVFIICPIKLRVLRAMLGIGGLSGLFHFDPREHARLLVVPWDDVDKPIELEIEPRFIFHFANAFERDGELFVDFVQYPNADVVTALSGNDDDARSSSSRLQQIRVDLARRCVVADETLWNHVCEFPILPPESVGEDHNVVWLVSGERGRGRGITRFEPGSGVLDTWHPGDGIRASEPMFVRRPGGADDEGWLVTLALDGLERRSFFAVLDAKKPSDGPLARLWFDRALHTTYHGIVVPKR